MQLTSESEEDRSLRHSPPSLWSRLNHPLVPGIIAFLGWLGFALARWQIWAKGHLSLFIMAGQTQKNLQHEVPKEPDIMQPRINLTFRRIEHKP